MYSSIIIDVNNVRATGLIAYYINNRRRKVYRVIPHWNRTAGRFPMVGDISQGSSWIKSYERLCACTF